MSIPILIDDLSSFFSIREKLGGYLMLKAKNKEVQFLIKNSLRGIKQIGEDLTDLEKNWVRIYKSSTDSTFYKTIKGIIDKLPVCNFVLEHGCSIGTTSEILAKHALTIFGIDKSFHALHDAKKRGIKNSDFFLADSLKHPFGDKKFEMVVALNLLELIEPVELIKIINGQTQTYIILSDPYDFERGKGSVKIKLDARSVRSQFSHLGFQFLQKTAKPSFIPWKLYVNQRLGLHYKVDLIVAKRAKIVKENTNWK
jgi:hypothetical protein